MKIKIEISDNIEEEEIVIRCSRVTDQIQKIQAYLAEAGATLPKLTYYKNGQEYYFPLERILFFETSESNVYAHTRDDTFRIKLRLYELDDLLPNAFVRISKSTIVNSSHILAVTRNLTSSSLIEFHQSHKQVYASRRYYKLLNQRLNERSS